MRHTLPRTILATAIAVVLGSLAPVATAATASAAPQMSVTITDGLKTVKSGTTTTYTTGLTNLGADPVKARVVLTLPSYVTVTSAHAGTVAKTDTTWAITVKPKETSKLELTAKIGDIPKTEVRVTAVASVYIDGATPSPLIRTADANRIDGVADTPKPAPGAATAPTSSNTLGWIVAAVIAGIMLVLAVAFSVVALRRRASIRSARSGRTG